MREHRVHQLFFRRLQIHRDDVTLDQLSDFGADHVSAEAKAALKGKADAYRKTSARYESEPETNEGKKELMARAKEFEKKRDHALKQDPYFDYAEALLQIAIVLISVSIVATLPWLAVFGGTIGIVGTLLMINGYTLAVDIPFMA